MCWPGKAFSGLIHTSSQLASTSLLKAIGVCNRCPVFGDFFFFWFFFSELGTEPRAMHFLGKRSTTELNPNPCPVFELPVCSLTA